MSWITTDDKVKLYYKDWGEGRPVILLHGWPLSADSWDDQAMAIAEAGYRVIAYDRRGFGRSEQPFGPYHYDRLADDLANVIEATNADNATIIGFSMGGGEVARYMTRHRAEHVAQAALISSVVPYMLKTDDNPEGVPQETFDEMTQGMKNDRAAFFADFFKDFYNADETDVSEQILEWSRSVSMSASLKATLACAEAFATTDFRPDLANFSVPTLIIHGTGDRTVPIDASGRPAAAGIATAELKEYDAAPHGLFATHKMQLEDDLLEFLGRI